MPIPIDVTLPSLPPRPEESNKGTFGKALIVAGSRGMSGAACLAGLGALRGGAGLVQVALPEGILPIVAAVEPSFLTVPLPEDDHGRLSRRALGEILPLAEHATATAIGPGWGVSSDLLELAHAIFTSVAGPLVIDADGLNALSKVPGGWPKAPEGAPRVITPHPGEFARLLRSDTKTVQADRETLAAEFAARHGLVVLLKGNRTVITDGQRVAVNTTGNSGMATGGTGDVLTGLITALLAQGLAPFDAARLGAHLHGLAGDLAALELSKPGLIASDLPRYLAKAWLQMGSG
ncbi:MAG TPA: NAD(P)H-hydrate dehydratase [Planctomycetaceae bacterium]|nr:NAD(P)H-hydrate dehydratase [Planctomycetaceae bacterium]